MYRALLCENVFLSFLLGITLILRTVIKHYNQWKEDTNTRVIIIFLDFLTAYLPLLSFQQTSLSLQCKNPHSLQCDLLLALQSVVATENSAICINWGWKETHSYTKNDSGNKELASRLWNIHSWQAVSYPKALRRTRHSSLRNSGASVQPLAHA